MLNLSDGIVLIVLAVVLVGAAFTIRKNKKQGKTGCGTTCTGNCNACRGDKNTV